jgi:putative transposase
MEALYQAAGISRQAFHSWLQPSKLRLLRTPEYQVIEMAQAIRKHHLPGSSSREVYFYIRNKHEKYNLMLFGWGKHTFEKLCLKNGLRIEYKNFVPKTTIRGSFMFPNRIQGMKISGINQVWVSDICYIFGSNGKLIGYATSLIDLYSRRLLGLSFSKTMHAAVTSQEVLRQALKVRSGTNLKGLIVHSDGGKQYIESMFVDTLRRNGIESSMAESCYENAFAEAFNDILKNHMMSDMSINSFSQLKKQERFLKNCYNRNRPHNSIQRRTPVEFEQHVLTLQPCQRTILEIKVIEQNLNPKNESSTVHRV